MDVKAFEAESFLDEIYFQSESFFLNTAECFTVDVHVHNNYDIELVFMLIFRTAVQS
jgi:hypothetical protein